MSENMTVGKLREVIAHLPADMRVCCATDPEGNSFHSSVEPCVSAFNFRERESIHPEDASGNEPQALVIWPDYGLEDEDEAEEDEGDEQTTWVCDTCQSELHTAVDPAEYGWRSVELLCGDSGDTTDTCPRCLKAEEAVSPEVVS